MNAPTYTASDFAEAFGDEYHPGEGESRGLLIPLNALHACSQELQVLSLATNEHHVDFEMCLLHVARRMELAASVGHAEIRALVVRVKELEAQLAAATKPEAAE